MAHVALAAGVLVFGAGRTGSVFGITRNDPAGEWTLRAWDPLSGQRAERRFRVEGEKSKLRRVAIVIPPSSRSRTIDIAAAEFAKYYGRIVGEKPVSIGTAAVPGTVSVRIGVPDADMSFDGEHDSYRIRSGDGGVTLAGGNPRSTLYAVYDFLERRGGCRWFWDGDVVPVSGEIDFGGLDVYEVSRFDYRAIQYFAHRGLVRFEPEGWGLDDWKREIDWCAKSRLNFFMMQIGMDDIFQKAFPDVVPYPDPSKTAWCDSKSGFDKRSPFWPLEFRGRLRKAILDYARDRGLMHPAKFGTQTHWFSRTPKDFLDKMQPEFLAQSTGGMAERSGLVWDVRKKKWQDAYWRLTEAEIESYGYDGLLFTPGFDERMCSTNRAENLAIKKRFNRLFIDEAYRRHPDAKVLIEGWDLYVGWWPWEIREFLSELDPKRTVIWDYSADATRLSRNLPLDEQKQVNDITNWGIRGRFPYVFGIMLAYDHATDIRANYALIRERFKKVVDDPMCKGISLWPETSHSDILALRYLAENFWRPSSRSTEDMLADFCKDRYGSSSEPMRKIWTDVLPMSRLADWRRILPIELAEICEHWNSDIDDVKSIARVFYGDFTNGVPRELCAAPEVFSALAQLPWEGDFIRRDSMDLARTAADRFIVRAGRELVRLYRARKGGDAAATQTLKRKAASYVAMGELFAQLLALHPDYSLAESLDRMDAVEKIRNPEFEKVFYENTGGTWYCRSHQYELARGAYVGLMEFVASTLVLRAETGDFSMLPSRPDVNPYVMMGQEDHPIRSRRPSLARTPDNWKRVLSGLARQSADFLR